MRNIIYLLVTLITCSYTYAQTDLNNLTAFLKTQNQLPKDYVIELFKTNDIVIIGERDHRDTTQYDVLIDIISDPYFINNVGHIYTEVGVINMSENVNKVLKGKYNSCQEFDKEFTKMYRDMDYNPIWEKYNMYKFMRAIYKINSKTDKKITITLIDNEFNWEGITAREYRYFKNGLRRNYHYRDSILAYNFMDSYEIQKPVNARKKALVIISRPHAVKMDMMYNNNIIKSTGSYIYDKYCDNVKVVLFNWYKWMPPGWFDWMPERKYELTADGKWDAAFELTNNTPVAFNIASTPFGKTVFDYNYEQLIQFQDVADGIMYYKPFYKFVATKGIPNIIDNDFEDELLRRVLLFNGRNGLGDAYKRLFSKRYKKVYREYYNTVTYNECVDYNQLKKQMNIWLSDKYSNSEDAKIAIKEID
ncbi:MAG: hypothetical protein N4A72_20940 [Bacteroidales bacterium]|jgi:hypothetical protein|nr:hypothetical protein [Bacteroidales bacterium]